MRTMKRILKKREDKKVRITVPPFPKTQPQVMHTYGEGRLNTCIYHVSGANEEGVSGTHNRGQGS